MFKRVHDRVWAFDAEWVPDPPTGRAVYGLGPELSDEAVVDEMWQRGGATEEDPRPYLKTVLCRVVSIAAVTRAVERGKTQVALHSLPDVAGGQAEMGEADIISRFLDGVGKQKPQLVGFNSEGADLRILLQRALANDVTAPDFARRPEKPWEGVDYFTTTAADWHIDLIEAIGGRGRGRPSLHEVAVSCGIPGKFTGAGSDVLELWRAGEVDRIVAYNEFDALTTYLLWLRVALFGGFLSATQHGEEEAAVAKLLKTEAADARPHLQDFLDEWERVGAAVGRAPLGGDSAAASPGPAEPAGSPPQFELEL